MTKTEALAEARRRWGSKANVFYQVPPRYSGLPKRRYFVARPEDAQFGNATGFGDTWEAAFEDADQREKGTP